MIIEQRVGGVILVFVLDRPFLIYLLSKLRNKNTVYPEFRRIMRKIGVFLGYEIANRINFEKTEVSTPLGKTDGLLLSEDIVLVAILRAALPLVEGFSEVFEGASIGFVVAKRIEKNSSEKGHFDVEISYINIPRIEKKILVIPDPMLATGSTIIAVIDKILEQGKPKRLIVCSVIASKYGISRVESTYPQVEIFTVSIDENLDSRGFIVPGLGDAGDRAFGTNS